MLDALHLGCVCVEGTLFRVVSREIKRAPTLVFGVPHLERSLFAIAVI